MNAKVEFLSDAWFHELGDRLTKYVRSAGSEVSFSLCEVFTDVPKHIDKGVGGRIAWHCRIAHGAVTLMHGEVDDVDYKSINEYAFVLQLARMRIEPATQVEYTRLTAEGVRSGKQRSVGDPSRIPNFLQGLHNELADITV